jgi:hypothetical protein
MICTRRLGNEFKKRNVSLAGDSTHGESRKYRKNSTNFYPCSYTEAIGQTHASTPGNYEGKMRKAFCHKIV